MTTIEEIIDFLKKIDQLIEIGGRQDQGKAEIKTVATDRDAQPGQLSWLSPKQQNLQPERIPSFRGSLLICSPEESEIKAESKASTILKCKNPKFAFVRTINQFFKSLAETVWPSSEKPIAPDAKIHKTARLSPGVIIGSNVIIDEHVSIGPNTVIANCKIGKNSSIGANCSFGLDGFGYEKDNYGKYWKFPHLGRIIIKDNVEIGSNTCIDRGSLGDTVIESGVKIDNLVHIAHNVAIGTNTMVIANSMIGGSAIIGENVWVAPSVSILNQISIDNSAFIGMGAVVLKNVGNKEKVVGNPAKILAEKSK